jgi:hypothetical protein
MISCLNVGCLSPMIFATLAPCMPQQVSEVHVILKREEVKPVLFAIQAWEVQEHESLWSVTVLDACIESNFKFVISLVY